jgi:exopolysaccharide production protein ExoZ
MQTHVAGSRLTQALSRPDDTAGVRSRVQNIASTRDRSLMQWLSHHFELSRGGNAANVRPMEGMRGFAVMLVFLVHFASLVAPWSAPGAPFDGTLQLFHIFGNAGVDLFFVLSGYLIYGSLIARPQPFLAFMKRRVLRIYPAFLVVFVLKVVYSAMRPEDSRIPSGIHAGGQYLVENLLLLPGLLPIEPLITVAWSLSYEMFYYLVMPALVLVFALRARSSAWRVGFFLILGCLILLVCAAVGGPVRLIMFISGILLHEALRRPAMRAPRGAFAAAALVAALVSTTMPFFGGAALSLKMLVLFGAFFVVCLHCFSEPQAWLARRFSWTPLRWLGNMSYSFYLLHGLTLKVGFLLLAKLLPVAPNALLVALMLPLMLGLTLLTSAALFLLVERPLSLAPAGKSAALTTAEGKVSA